MFQPRPAQQKILEYLGLGGKMGVSAVPGSGKTVTLSYLAAQLVKEKIRGDEEVLIVTFANSAVDHFTRRIREFLQPDASARPDAGYRVRTLHGLAHDILRERPTLLGLPEDFDIVDERVSTQLLEDLVANWLRVSGVGGDASRRRLTLEELASGGSASGGSASGGSASGGSASGGSASGGSASGGSASGGSASGGSASGGSASGGSASGDASYSNAVFDFFIDPQIDANRRQWLERERWPGMVTAIVGAFIRRAKDLQLTPAAIRARMPSFEADWLLSKMCLEIYEDYQRALANRGSVDFDDLIRLALEALQIDADLLARLQRKWPYILEDEAQDSSYLQERILRLLTDEGNWVRVGDPNQSINTTFTTSDIRFLNQFLDEEDVVDSPLLHSGRSTQRIVDLANYLVEWTNMAHPNPVVRERAFRTQRIYPVPPGDAQPNPADTPDLVVQLYNEALAPEKEIDLVVRSLQRWLPEHKHATVAVLAPDNTRGFKVSERLKAAGIEYDELLRSTASTREATRRLAHVLRYLSAPLSGSLLAKVFEVYARPAEGDEADAQAARDRKLILTGLRRLDQVEAFIWPRPDRDELPEFAPASDPAIRAQLIEFRRVVQRWLAASHLPIDQLVLTVAQDVYREGDADQVVRHLALAHKIALVLRRLAADRPEWRLPDLAAELDRVANNEQRFLGFSEDDLSFTPRPGRVTVATMHKAKGLEWDRVYLLGVNNFDFPSAAPGDVYRGETWYVRGRLNLEAEGVAQLETLAEGGGYVPGVATNEARLAYAEERLRLLYVGITRARRELIITWNTGPREDEPHQAAAAFLGLWSYWESVQKPAGE